MPPTPTPRPNRTQVPVQVARTGRADAAGGVSSSPGRHRTPDAGRLPDPERVGRGAAQRPAVVPAQPGASSRRGAPAQRGGPAPAVGRPSTRAGAGPDRAGHDEAVTDLVAGPGLRGDDGRPDAPATGPVPGLLGLALGVVALLGAVVAAAEPGVVVPGIGPLGTSPLALVLLLATALLATACAGLGAGRHRRARAVAVTGMVVGLAGVAASLIPLLALGSP
jgi:hypothetical protein